MSNSLVFDPLLVHYLARELDQRLRGRACAAAPLFGKDYSALLPLESGQALRLDLHPTRGWIHVASRHSDSAELDAVCLGVEAVPDERLLRIHLRSGDRFRVSTRCLVLELHTNQWNALLLNVEDERILSVLRSRSAGDRVLQAGQIYRPPPAPRRFGLGELHREEAWDRWKSRLSVPGASQRRRVLLGEFAYTGTPNANWILGSTSDSDEVPELRAAFDRWWWIRSLPGPAPVLLRLRSRTLPYPLPLEGVAAETVSSLLEGMSRLAEADETTPSADSEPEIDALRHFLRRGVEIAARRVTRLEEQLGSAGEAERLRDWGDLLLAYLHAVPRGAESTTLTDWEGNPVEIPLDPTLSPAENANHWYDEARKRSRADAKLPELLEEARSELIRWREAAAALQRQEPLPGWVERELEKTSRHDTGTTGETEKESRPYRGYRTSGGLEVRVGRSSRENDRLTFKHSRPNDIWLHARSVPGSHVILRWPDAEGAPPARDLEEAATLAALFSKARTSALVPVDWTRRKYVRKPRGAPPGAVIPQQVKTVFVEPNPEVEERLRE